MNFFWVFGIGILGATNMIWLVNTDPNVKIVVQNDHETAGQW